MKAAVTHALATVAFDPFSYVLAGAPLPYGTTTLFPVSGSAVLACAALACAALACAALLATSPAIRSLR